LSCTIDVDFKFLVSYAAGYYSCDALIEASYLIFTAPLNNACIFERGVSDEIEMLLTCYPICLRN